MAVMNAERWLMEKDGVTENHVSVVVNLCECGASAFSSCPLVENEVTWWELRRV